MPRRDHGGSLRDAFGAVGTVRRLAERFRKLRAIWKGLPIGSPAIRVAIIGVIVTFVVGLPGAVFSCCGLGWGWCSLSASEASQASRPPSPTVTGGGTALEGGAVLLRFLGRFGDVCGVLSG